MNPAEFEEHLRAMTAGGMKFIVVGGLAAVLGGAPVATFDVDAVHARDSENIDRLLDVLESLDAMPNASHLAGPGHQNLRTRYGALDLLGTIGRNLSYADLLLDSEEVDIGGATIRVLKLEKLIELKEELGDERDRAMLPVLKRTLEEKRRRIRSEM